LVVEAKPTFEFSFPSPMISLTGSSSQVTTTPSTLISGFFGPVTLSGAYSGSFTAVTTNTLALQNYFATAPVINSYGVAYSVGPTGLGGGAQTTTNFAGNISLEYQYVPGPLPILGASAAFGWTRRLRKRISKLT
jgi:hypothetical protein